MVAEQNHISPENILAIASSSINVLFFSSTYLLHHEYAIINAK